MRVTKYTCKTMEQVQDSSEKSCYCLNVSGFQSWWLHSLAFLGFDQSSREWKKHDYLGKDVRTREEVESICSKVLIK